MSEHVKVEGLCRLQGREWLDALNAAILLALRAEEKREPFPLGDLRGSLDTWGGVIGNLMSIVDSIYRMGEQK